MFDEKFDTDIEMTDDGSAFYIYAVVGKAPGEDNTAFYKELLAANLFGHGTGNGSLALDTARNEILLSRRFSQDLTDGVYDNFVRWVSLYACPAFPEVIETVAEDSTPEGQDGIGPVDGPVHAPAFEPGGDHVLAGPPSTTPVVMHRPIARKRG